MTNQNETREPQNEAGAESAETGAETPRRQSDAAATAAPQEIEPEAVTPEVQLAELGLIPGGEAADAEAVLAHLPAALAAIAASPESGLAPESGAPILSNLFGPVDDDGGSTAAAKAYYEDGFGNEFGAAPRGPFEGLPMPGLEITKDTQDVPEEDVEPEPEEEPEEPPYTPPTIDPDNPDDPDCPDDPDYPDDPSVPGVPDEPQDPNDPQDPNEPQECLELGDLLPDNPLLPDLPPCDPEGDSDGPGFEDDIPVEPTQPGACTGPVEILTDLMPTELVPEDTSIAA